MRSVQTKYRAVPTIVNGIRFASKKESRRYKELLLLRATGNISHLVLQPKFDITIHGFKICRYIADFQYVDLVTKKVITEDAKGFLTPVYRIKKKLMAAVMGVEITEV